MNNYTERRATEIQQRIDLLCEEIMDIMDPKGKGLEALQRAKLNLKAANGEIKTFKKAES